MKLIIDIPDKMYETVQNGTYCGTLYVNLKNGTPLSESEDCVSRQAVLNLAKFDGRDGLGSIIHAFDVEQLPPVTPAEKQEPCDDCIRREDALMALTGEYVDSPIEILPKAIKRINKLSPVTPVEKIGQWISNKNDDLKISDYTCSRCGKLTDEETNYCPNCGQPKMHEVEE